MATALIALGSNLGPRQEQLDGAIDRLTAHPQIRVLKISSWRPTKPIGGPADQPEFLNGAALLETSLEPEALRLALADVESASGRVRETLWQARTLDLDLLLYDDQIIDTPTLQVPHPRMAFRRFVIDPAAEIAAKMIHPTIGWTIGRLQLHLHNEPPYVAIVDLPGAGKTEVARAVADAVNGRIVTCSADLAGSLASQHEASPIKSITLVTLAPGELRATRSKLLVFLDGATASDDEIALRSQLVRDIDDYYRGPLMRIKNLSVVDATAQVVAAIQAMENG